MGMSGFDPDENGNITRRGMVLILFNQGTNQ